MSSLKVILGLLAAGLALSGCMPATHFRPPLKPPSSRTTRPSSPRRAMPLFAGRAVPPRHRRLSPQGSCRAPSWSIPTTTISIWFRMAARRSATASPSAKKPSPSPASPESAAWPNGRNGRRRRGNLQTYRRPARLGARWRRQSARRSRALSLLRATRTRCSASTAPTSRNISAPRSPRAASA